MDAVRALPDVTDVTFDIPTETFTVDLAEDGKADTVLSAIKKLEFQPRLLDVMPTAPAERARIETPTSPRLKAALAQARERKVPLLVIFGGAFCPTCEAFERDVLSDSRVRDVLRAFEFVDFDVKDDPAAASDLGVKAVPDTWILSGDGAVLARENRAMDVATFLQLLEKHALR